MMREVRPPPIMELGKFCFIQAGVVQPIMLSQGFKISTEPEDFVECLHGFSRPSHKSIRTLNIASSSIRTKVPNSDTSMVRGDISFLYSLPSGAKYLKESAAS